MALSVSVTARKILGYAELLTSGKFNLANLITIGLSGTVDTTGITNNAVTVAKAAGGAWFWGTDTGTANAHVVTTSQTLTALATGVIVAYEVAAATPNTGPVTVNVNGLGALAVKQANLQDLRTGDISQKSVMTLRYSSAGYWVMTAPGRTNGDRYATSTGSANAYVFTTAGLWSPVTAVYDGLRLTFKANFANTTIATLNVDGLGAVAIRKQNNQPLISGDILVDQIVGVVYDATLAAFVMVSQPGNGSAVNNAGTRLFLYQSVR